MGIVGIGAAIGIVDTGAAIVGIVDIGADAIGMLIGAA